MKIVVFGATGGAGAPFVDAALAAGHEVTAIARDPSAVPPRERLRVIEANITDPDAVAAAIAGADTVVCAIGPRSGAPAGTLISDTARNVLLGMKKHGVKRFVLVSGLMVGDGGHLNALQRFGISVFRRMNRDLYDDKVRAEALVHASDVDWRVVRPPVFGAIPPVGAFRIGPEITVKLTKMSNVDVGAALLVAATSEEDVRKDILLSY